MNFIIKLLKSKNSTINVIYDIIFVIVNRFIKYTHFISIKKKYNKIIKIYRVKSNDLILRNIFENNE